MKARMCGVALLGAAVLSGMACQQKAGLSEQDRAAIQKIDETVNKMGVGPNVDWDAYVKLYYTEDAKVLMPGMPAIEGRDAIKKAFAAMGTVQDEKWNRAILEGRGDLAYESGSYLLTVLPPGETAPLTDKGKFITLWKKQADGTWKATRDIWNSDLPPAGLTIPTGPMKADAGKEIQQLGRLIGAWNLEGDSKGSPFMPAGKMSATLDCQWFSGGTQILCLYDLVNPSGRVHEISMYGYDPGTKAYWCYDTDSTGLSSLGKVGLKDNSWTHVWDYKMDGKAVRMRLVLSNLTPNGCSWKNDVSVAGGPWACIVEGTATKTR